MPLLLRPATEADTARLGRIGRDAFRDTVSLVLFPPHLACKSPTGDPDVDEVQWRDDRSLQRMRDGNLTFVVVDAPDRGSEAGEIVGFSQWELPAPPNAAPAQANQVALPGSLDQEALQHLFTALDRESHRLLGPDGHSNMWYLMLLAIDPDQQRRGIGRMLAKHGIDLAAKVGKDVFLVATPEGKPLYQSLGFRQLGDSFDVLGTIYSAMLWSSEPRVTS
ncbi:puromycin N-acetyltransferase [Staphylotrichum tortipilum]|uniref:Puromycin N-acetyltransferase n=1 Tax=Staphylotrichum tortipilum TaxID=2831512 RepID=A0AAN6MIJ7_9PEZI|nr:puromycin N-acetyltransferase [Staphylotrichum longicolle]